MSDDESLLDDGGSKERYSIHADDSDPQTDLKLSVISSNWQAGCISALTKEIIDLKINMIIYHICHNLGTDGLILVLMLYFIFRKTLIIVPKATINNHFIFEPYDIW